jgi:hypothetical protein
MLPLLRWCARRVSLLGLAALAAGFCLLVPTATSARGTTHLRSASTAASAQDSSGEPPTESGGETPGEQRDAHRNAEAASGCDVSLEATASTIAPASPLSLAGTLSCPEGVSAAGQTVTLYQKVARTSGFNVAATASTEANGDFHFALSGPEGNSVFYVRSEGVKSARTRVKVAGPQVVIDAPANGTPLFVAASRAAAASGGDNSTVTFTGRVSPADPGATVTLQREYRPAKWHRVGVGQVNTEGGFSIPHTFYRPGEANIRVVVHFHGLYADSISAPVTYQISRQRRKG